MGQPGKDNSQQVKALQVITFAIIAGVVTFGAIVLFLATTQETPKASYLSYIALAFAIVMVAVRTIIGNFLTTAFRTGLDATVWDESSDHDKDTRLVANMKTKHIVEMAILDAAAIFNCIAYLLEKNIVSIVVVIGLLIVMAFAFPSGSKIKQWVDNQKQLINLGT